MTKTLDDFLDGRIKLIQPLTGYRAGIDPIFLSASLHPTKQEKILDVGCGVGTAAIALAFRCPHVTVTGIEVCADLCELASMNIQKNKLEERVNIIQTDILSAHPSLALTSFDHIVTNPPYYENNRNKVSPCSGKAQGNMETMALGNWIDHCLKFLKPKGLFTIIHRAERLSEILTYLANQTGDMVVYPLWPSLTKPARRVIVQARKNGGGELRLARGLILHGESNKYTPEAEAVLRHAQSLIL